MITVLVYDIMSIPINSVKKSKNTVEKVTNVTENKTLVNLWGFPLI